MNAPRFQPLQALDAIRDSDLPPVERLVLVMLALRCNPQHQCRPSYARIAKDTGLGRRTTIGGVGKLVARGLVTITGTRDECGDQAPNVFTLHLEGLGVVQEEHRVVQEEHHLVQDDHQGSAPGALGVVLHVHGGSAPRAPEGAQGRSPVEGAQGRISVAAIAAPVLPGFETPSKPEKKTRASKAKHTPEEIAQKERLVAHFVAVVQAAKKILDVKVSHAGDHAAAFDLVKSFGLEEALSIITRGLEDTFVLRSNCTIRYIASKADSWRGKANGTGPMVQPPAPGGSKFASWQPPEVQS